MAEYHQIFGAAITKKMKTEQVTGAIEKLLEGLEIESIREMVKSLDLNAPAEINEAATDYFAGLIGGKATREEGRKIADIIIKVFDLPEVNCETVAVFAGAYAAHRILSADNGPLTVGEVIIAFCAYHMACVSYRSRIGYHFGIEGLLKVNCE